MAESFAKLANIQKTIVLKSTQKRTSTIHRTSIRRAYVEADITSKRPPGCDQRMTYASTQFKNDAKTRQKRSAKAYRSRGRTKRLAKVKSPATPVSGLVSFSIEAHLRRSTLVGRCSGAGGRSPGRGRSSGAGAAPESGASLYLSK